MGCGVRDVPGWVTGALATAVSGLVGVSVLAVATAAGEPAFEHSGEYVDGRHGVADFGQRWHDPRHHVMLSTDAAPTDDPGALAEDPQLAQSYALNHANSYRYGDPDGRQPRRNAFSLVIEPDGGGYFHPDRSQLWEMDPSDKPGAPGVEVDTTPVRVDARARERAFLANWINRQPPARIQRLAVLHRVDPSTRIGALVLFWSGSGADRDDRARLAMAQRADLQSMWELPPGAE